MPLAVPMIAGPSTIAVLQLLSNAAPERMGEWVVSPMLVVQMLLKGFGNYYNRCLQKIPCAPTAAARDAIQNQPKQETQ